MINRGLRRGMLTASILSSNCWQLGALRSAVIAWVTTLAVAAPCAAQTLPIRPQANNDTIEIEAGATTDISVLANDVLGTATDPVPKLKIVKSPTCGEAVVSPADPLKIRYTDGVRDAPGCASSTRSFVYEVQLPDRATGPMATVTITIGRRQPEPLPPPPAPPQPQPPPTPPPSGHVAGVCEVQGASFKMMAISRARIGKLAISPDLERYAAWLDDDVRTVEPACIMTSPVTFGELRNFIEGLRPEERERLIASQLEAMSDDSTDKPEARSAGGVSHPLAMAYAASLSARYGRTFTLPSLYETAAAVLEANKASNDPAKQLFGIDVARGRFEWTSTSCPSGDNGFWTVGTGGNDRIGRFCFGADSVEANFSFRLIMR